MKHEFLYYRVPLGPSLGNNTIEMSPNISIIGVKSRPTWSETLRVCRGQWRLSFLRYLSKAWSGTWHTKGDVGTGFASLKSSPQLRVKKSFCLPETIKVQDRSRQPQGRDQNISRLKVEGSNLGAVKVFPLMKSALKYSPVVSVQCLIRVRNKQKLTNLVAHGWQMSLRSSRRSSQHYRSPTCSEVTLFTSLSEVYQLSGQGCTAGF